METATMAEQRSPRVFHGVPDLVAAIGADLGRSGRHLVGQPEIEAFAEVTGDRQWIHVDPVRAGASPFGNTVAHGYYILSIMTRLLAEVFRIEDIGMVINTGVDELRFLRPVPAGSLVSVGVRLAAARVRRRGVAELSLDVQVYLDDQDEPCATAVLHSMVRPPSGAVDGGSAQPVERAGSR